MSKVIRASLNGAIQLSKNFYLSEFTSSQQATRHGIDNTPNPAVTANLFKLAALMEEVRKLLGGKAILVSSGYRSPEVNARVGGSAVSEHLHGLACDFTAPGFGTPLQICKAIAKSNILFGQLIFEGTWVHISVADGVNDRDVMTAVFKRGEKTRYLKGLPA